MKSGGRQYKNVYTILEKVKKGEIQTYYNKGESLFSKLDFYKKPDIIKPYMHYIDERRLDSIIDNLIRDNIYVYKLFQEAKKKDVRLASVGKSEFHSRLMSIYYKIPAHVKHDIFKLYYNKIEKLEFSERTKENKAQYKFIEKVNSPVAKIMSENSNLKSAIFARDILFYFAWQMTLLSIEDKDKFKDLEDMLKNGFDDQNQEAFNDLMDKTFSETGLEKTLEEASKTCKTLDETIDNETQEYLYENASTSEGASKLSIDYINTASANIKRIKLSIGSLKDKIKKLMDKTTSYFSSKKVTVVEDLFNSDNIAGLDDYIDLHPKLRKILIEDITIKETKSIGKIDVYIDVSGSMSSLLNIKDAEGNNISRMDFVKAFTIKMEEQDLLNNVFIFNSKVKKYKKDEFSLAVLESNGGTCISRVVESIKHYGNNAIVLTDAEDGCEIYSEKAYFIGVDGAKFHHFESKTREKYVQNDQIVIFDGSKIYRVDKSGYKIK